MKTLVEINNIPIQEISTCSILVPLLLAGFKLKTGGFKFHLFFLFLLFGAIVDGYGWFVYSTDRNPVPHGILQYCYLFFEAIFFVWLCTGFLHYSKSKLLRRIFCVLLSSTFVFKGWVLYTSNWNPSLASGTNSVLDGVFLISISFLSAFALLHMAERELDLLSFPWFWILSGIFFYCFGSFFIDLIVRSGLIANLWKLRNFVNIIQYGFFIMGIVRLRPKRTEGTVPHS
ncbi:hypothetical protein [Algoriphagus sp. NG3]|uniref:hypothetical protein n=1 Tax=Algoriphagus sp. NG3 TaxID=3097546 RepID=UPI002A7F9FBF|nr:hypothetical protein [Algoriphagus sp. NG3]WPR77682.1 hypothetical protein SLW71_10035 [Algoriphagus sp. NG3]